MEGSRHRWLYDEPALIGLFRAAGLVEVEVVDPASWPPVSSKDGPDARWQIGAVGRAHGDPHVVAHDDDALPHVAREAGVPRDLPLTAYEELLLRVADLEEMAANERRRREGLAERTRKLIADDKILHAMVDEVRKDRDRVERERVAAVPAYEQLRLDTAGDRLEGLRDGAPHPSGLDAPGAAWFGAPRVGSSCPRWPRRRAADRVTELAVSEKDAIDEDEDDDDVKTVEDELERQRREATFARRATRFLAVVVAENGGDVKASLGSLSEQTWPFWRRWCSARTARGRRTRALLSLDVRKLVHRREPAPERPARDVLVVLEAGDRLEPDAFYAMHLAVTRDPLVDLITLGGSHRRPGRSHRRGAGLDRHGRPTRCSRVTTSAGRSVCASGASRPSAASGPSSETWQGGTSFCAASSTASV